MQYRLKLLISRIIFWFLGRGIKTVSVLDSTVAKEIEEWDEGATISMIISQNGPSLTVTKRNGRLELIDEYTNFIPNLVIQFKHINIAVKLLTGQMGIAQGFSEHRFTMKGDISFGMSFVRILYMVEAYLFPTFMAKKILKQLPFRERNRLQVYKGILFGVK